MSRSYKKYPCVKDRNPFAKMQANKLVRRTKDIPNGKSYRKIYDSWNISDYVFEITWGEYWFKELNDWKRRDEYFYYLKRGYPFFCKKGTPQWVKENPEIHKRKHQGKWKKKYLCK